MYLRSFSTEAGTITHHIYELKHGHYHKNKRLSHCTTHPTTASIQTQPNIGRKCPKTESPYQPAHTTQKAHKI